MKSRVMVNSRLMTGPLHGGGVVVTGTVGDEVGRGTGNGRNNYINSCTTLQYVEINKYSMPCFQCIYSSYWSQNKTIIGYMHV